jgi:uncharacterized membrane protein
VPEVSDSSVAVVRAARLAAAVRSNAPAPSSIARPAWSLGRVALACAEIALASVSLLLCLRLFMMPDAQLDAFIGSNVLPATLRDHLLLEVFAAALLPLAVFAMVYLRAGIQVVPCLVRAGEICAPLTLACFVPNLLDYREWYSEPLPYLIQLLGFVLTLERLLTRAFAPGMRSVTMLDRPRNSRLARAIPLAVVLMAAAGYALYMSHFTIMRHQLLGTAGFDLGIFDNLMWNAMHGRPFRSTVAVPNGSYLSNHAEYGMFLFVPLYALHPGPETLLILQSSFIALAAVPLYLFAATQISRAGAAALACAYLIYAPLHGPNFYDFHWMPMTMGFFFWLFYAIARRQLVTIALLSMVICSMREDTAFGLIAVGLFLIVTGHWPRLGVVLTAVSGAWFVVVKFIIMPWAGPWWFADIYKDLMAAGEKGYGSVVRTILIDPNYFLKTLLTEAKVSYALHLLAPLGLLAVRHPALAVLMLPGFFVTLMTTGYAPTVSITFQYTTTWIPFLFGAVAIALRLRARKYGPAARRASLVALCVGVLCHSYVFGAIFQHNSFVGGFSRVYFDMSPGEYTRYLDLRAVANQIPKNASVAATEQEIPHVSTRLDAYTLKITAGQADYLFLNKHHLDAEAKQQLRNAFNERGYGLVARKGDFFLFGIGHVSKDTDSALKALGIHGVRTHS